MNVFGQKNSDPKSASGIAAPPTSTSETMSKVTLNGNSAHSITGVVGAKMKITGNIEFEGELRVIGLITGNVSSISDKSVLIVEESAIIEGDIEVPVLKISGKIKGNISSSEHIHLLSSSIVDSHIKYNNMQMDSGAFVTGSLSPEFKKIK